MKAKTAVALLLVALLVACAGSAKVSVGKTAPDQTDVGAKTMVVLEISADSAASQLDVVETLPLPLALSEWSVSGYDEGRVSFEERAAGDATKYHWSFLDGIKGGQAATLTYFFTSPARGSFNLTTLYLYPAAFDRRIVQVKVVDDRPFLAALMLLAVVLLAALYVRQRRRRGEKKMFSPLHKKIRD